MSRRFNTSSPAKFMGQNRATIFPPIPQPFDFDARTRCPLMPLRAITMHVGGTVKDVTALIEDGKLRWAFDIRSANARRRELRVLTQSFSEYVGHRRPRITVDGGDAEFAKVMDLVLPTGVILTPGKITPPLSGGNEGAVREVHKKLHLSAILVQNMLFPREPVLCGTEVAESFCCLGQHVLNLIRENTLKTVNFRRGPKSTPLIIRSSVIEFLKNRRIA